MPDLTTESRTGRTSLLRKIRMVTGCVIFAYVVGHLGNLAFGIWSLESMDAVRPYFLAPWQNPVGVVALYGSVTAHMLLGLEALYRRRTLRMTGFDNAQLFMALVLPPLVVWHVLSTRGAFMISGLEPRYDVIMIVYWKWLPFNGLRQTLVVVAAWLHGCMGLYYWMRLQTWWPAWSGIVYPLVFVVPVAALLGYVEAGKEALELANDPAWMSVIKQRVSVMSGAQTASLFRAEKIFFLAYALLIAGVLAARAWRLRDRRRNAPVVVGFRDGPTVEGRAGLSLLEVSRAHHVPHASICGGRGRCGTCRVRVIAGAEHLPPISSLERETLQRHGAGPGARLACQVVPGGGPLEVERLMPVEMDAEDLHIGIEEPAERTA